MSRPAHTTPLLLAVAGGALLHLSQPPADLGPLALVAFLPWFAALRSLAATDAGPAVAFRVGYAAGLVVFLAGFEFLRTLSGVDASNLALYGLWLLVGALLALYAGTYSSVAYLVLRRPVREWIFLLPLAWTLLELPRYGMPASAPVFFPGYSLHRFPALVQSADLGGVHAVSFFVVAVNAALFAALVSWRRTPVRALGWAVAAILLVAAQAAYGVHRLGEIDRHLRWDGPRVALLQPNVPQELKNRDDRHTRRQLWRLHRDQTLALGAGLSAVSAPRSAPRSTFSVVSPRADLVVWPETSYPWTLGVDGAPRGPEPPDDADPRRLARHVGSALVVGATSEGEGGRLHNSAWAFDAGGDVLARHDKVFLVPGVERLPLAGTLAGAGLATATRRLGLEVPRLAPGEREDLATLQLRDGRAFRFSLSVCFEFAFPQLFARLHRGETPHFAVAIANEAWYGDSAELDHALVMTRFRAIESRVSMVRAGNTGITAVIDPAGREVRRLRDAAGSDRLVAGTLVATLPYLPTPRPTVFTRLAGGAIDLFLEDLPCTPSKPPNLQTATPPSLRSLRSLRPLGVSACRPAWVLR